MKVHGAVAVAFVAITLGVVAGAQSDTNKLTTAAVSADRFLMRSEANAMLGRAALDAAVDALEGIGKLL